VWFVLERSHWFAGDVSLSAEDRPPKLSLAATSPTATLSTPLDSRQPTRSTTLDFDEEDEEEEPLDHAAIESHTAFKFLLAGGIAGAGQAFLPRILTSRSISFLFL
jgi:solute carrier family 25 phosphate transporter 23/24/25/41